MLKRVRAYIRLARFDKPTGWLLLLWPTLWALWTAAEGQPTIPTITLFIAGCILSRSFGCCINDIFDRRCDRLVARTRTRPLAAGEISLTEAWILALLLLASCFSLWLELSELARKWALGALMMTAVYPFTKRFLVIPQMWLGLTFSCGIPIAYAHVTGSVPALALLLVAANWCYVMAYDTIYALVDRDDDIKAGVKSSAVFFGRNSIMVITSNYCLMLALLMLFGVLHDFTLPFFLAILLGYGLFWHFVRMCRTFEPQRCYQAFNLNHLLGLLVWGGIIASYRAL